MRQALPTFVRSRHHFLMHGSPILFAYMYVTLHLSSRAETSAGLYNVLAQNIIPKAVHIDG